MKENVILMGYRGTQFAETGSVHMLVHSTNYDSISVWPKELHSRKGVMTRY